MMARPREATREGILVFMCHYAFYDDSNNSYKCFAASITIFVPAGRVPSPAARRLNPVGAIHAEQPPIRYKNKAAGSSRRLTQNLKQTSFLAGYSFLARLSAGLPPRDHPRAP